MSSIIKFITNNDTMIMLSLFILIIVLTIIVIITDFINRKKIRIDAEALFGDPNIDIEDAFNESIVEEPILDNTLDLAIIEPIKNLNIDDSNSNSNNLVQEIKYVEEDEELEKTKAQLELKTLKEELLKAEIKEKEKNKNTVEIIDDKDELNPIDEFEQAQEDNAIISLDQFNMIGGELYEKNEFVQYKDEGNEPISIKELERLYNSKDEIDTTKEIITIEEPIINVKVGDVIKSKTNTEVIESKPINTEFKFKKSPIISPVYGMNTEENLESIKLENTANLEKLNEEIKKTNEFLNTLKELRKSLH